MGMLNFREGMRQLSGGVADLAGKYIKEEFDATAEQRRSDLAVAQTGKIDQLRAAAEEEKRARINENYKKGIDTLALSRAKTNYGADGEGLTAADLSDEEKTSYVSPSDRRKIGVEAGLLNYKEAEAADERDVDNARQAERDKSADAFKREELDLRKREAGSGAALRSVQLEQAKLTLDALKREAKIPPAVKASADLLREEIKIINKTIYDKDAIGALTPEGQVSLSAKVAELTKKANALYEPYMPKGENGLPAGAVVRDFSSLGKKTSEPKPAATGSGQSSPKSRGASSVNSDDVQAQQEALAARRAKVDAERAAKMEAQRKRGEEIDQFNQLAKNR